MKRWCRYLPYAFVVWFAKRKLERFPTDLGIVLTTPFNGEILAFRTDKKETP